MADPKDPERRRGDVFSEAEKSLIELEQRVDAAKREIRRSRRIAREIEAPKPPERKD
jgi:hypothetical protein